MKTKLFKLCLIAPIGVSIAPSLASCSLVEDFKNRPRQIDGFDWIGRESGLIDPQFYRVDEEKQEVTYWNLTRIHTKDLIIPNYVMYKGKKCKVILDPQAFYGAQGNLVGSIELNDWCDTIPSECFVDDYNLSKVIFHVYPKNIEYQAFYNCPALKEIVVKNEDQTIDTNWAEEIVSIGDEAFWGAKVQGNLSFGPNLKSIGELAFNGNSLESVDFTRASQDFKLISTSAFESCTILNKVYFSKYINAVGNSAFGNCQNLKEVVVDTGSSSKTIESLGDSAFAYCDLFEGFKTKDGTLTINKIGNKCFQYDKSFKNLDQPWLQSKNLDSLPPSTFEGCKFTKWKLTENFKTIGSSAIAFNTVLSTIDLTEFEGVSLPNSWLQDPFSKPAVKLVDVFCGCQPSGNIVVKAGLWTSEQKKQWVDWFKDQGIEIGEPGEGHWYFVNNLN